MKLFKLTNSKNQTTMNTQWGENITHSVSMKKRGKLLCSSEVIHAYKNPNLALLLNSIHGDYQPCNLWEAKGRVMVEDWGKAGCWKLTTLKQLDLPDWYANERTRRRVQIRFAIICAEKVLEYFEKTNPEDQRPRKAIQAAREFLETNDVEKIKAAVYNPGIAYGTSSVSSADNSAARAASSAANSAARAANSAARAANTIVNGSDWNTDTTARFAARASSQAADASYAAGTKKIDFSALANMAVSQTMEESNQC